MSLTGNRPDYAVMQDHTILCACCITEVCDDRQPTEATTVHAWLMPDPGHSCRCCGATATSSLCADER